jgi:hypothetical protein
VNYLLKKCVKFSILSLALIIPMILSAPVMAAPNADAIHTVPAAETSLVPGDLTYDQLTTYCLSWGLSDNPYPTPPVQTTTVAYPIVYINNASDYHLLTFSISDDVYQVVACQVYNGTYNIQTKTTTFAMQITWYFGDWGKTNARMDQGFMGLATDTEYNSRPPPATPLPGYYQLIQFDLQGFGRFNHQTLTLTKDTRISPFESGYCTVLGNRDKN